MAQQGPNPIELYEGAIHYMRPILAGVNSSQLSNATPCTEWSVQQLINHNLKGADFVHGVLQGNVTVNPMEVGGTLPPEGTENAFVSGTNRVVELLKSTGDLNKVVETPFGQMPIAQLMMFTTLDIVIHKWDLAQGTGQNTSLDAGLAEVCYGALQMGAEAGRAGGAFGPEVSVPITASMQDKLLALSGRQP